MRFSISIFSWFKSIWAPVQQDKVFSNTVTISSRHSIIRFTNSDSTVCMTKRSAYWTAIFSTINFFLPDVPLRETRNQQCVRFWLCGVQFASAAWCTPLSLTQRYDAHGVFRLRGQSFLNFRISWRNLNQIRKYFILLIRRVRIEKQNRGQNLVTHSL